MEDSFIIEDVTDQPSAADCSADPPAPPTPPASPASSAHSLPDVKISAATFRLSSESSDEHILKVLWDTSKLIDLNSEEHELVSLKSSSEIKLRKSTSSQSFTAKMLKLQDLINGKFPISELSDEKVLGLESSSDSKMAKDFTDQMDISSTFQPCFSEESSTDWQMNSRIDSDESLSSDESFRLIPLIDLSDDIHYDREEPERPCYIDQVEPILQAGEKWDVKVYVGPQKFHCFQCVLQVYSPYFRRPKLEDTYVVRLPSHKVTPAAFQFIYKWMLLKEMPPLKRCSARSLLELYSSAKYLGITEITDAVWNALDIIKNENESFSLMPNMSYMNSTNIEFFCFARISRFFLTLVSSQEFIEMDFNYVSRLLDNPNAGVNSEIEIFYSAVRWLSHDWPDRVEYVLDLIRCIRFNLLSPIFLRFLQQPQSTRIMQYIANLPYVKDKIIKAFVYVTAELYCKDPRQRLAIPLPELEVPDQRRWVYDEKCSYHHDLKCGQRQLITYAQFLSYLKSLHETGPDHWRNLVYLTEPIDCCTRLRSE